MAGKVKSINPINSNANYSDDNIRGKANIPVEFVMYTGGSTATADTFIDNGTRKIYVNVKTAGKELKSVVFHKNKDYELEFIFTNGSKIFCKLNGIAEELDYFEDAIKNIESEVDRLNNSISELADKIENKQDKLTAGHAIIIDGAEIRVDETQLNFIDGGNLDD